MVCIHNLMLNIVQFPSPSPGQLGTMDYYCLDAASLLPVLALDVRPGQVSE